MAHRDSGLTTTRRFDRTFVQYHRSETQQGPKRCTADKFTPCKSTTATMAELEQPEFIAFPSSPPSGEENSISDVTDRSDTEAPLPTKISAEYDYKSAGAAYAAEERRTNSRSGVRTCCDQETAVGYATCSACPSTAPNVR